jgi:beta-galactosidase
MNNKRNRLLRQILVLLLLIPGSLHSKAQDTLQLNGEWGIQPASQPSVWPDAQAWSNGTPVDLKANWAWNLAAGKNTSWAAVPHDSIHSIWYRKTFVVPLAWKDKHVLIDFRRMEGDAIVFLNQQRVTELLRPGGLIDLTGKLAPGKENTLLVFVTRNYTGILRDFKNDPLRYQVRQANGNAAIPVSQWPMGITAPVTLFCKPAQFITDVFCMPSFRAKKMNIEVAVNATLAAGHCYLQAEILDEHNTVVLRFRSKLLTIPAGKTIYTIDTTWLYPKYWELEQPYLYKARVKLVKEGQPTDHFKDVSFGFREIWAAGKDIYMNGHLSRWRLTDLYGANKNGLSFYRQIGYNVGQIQPHSNLWWGPNTETPLLDEEMLDEMDRIGMGCTVPAPSVTKIRAALLNNPQAQKDYADEVAYYLKYYRNHPCIFAWVVAMNSSNPKENIWPATMGKRDTVYKGQAKVIDLACSIVKRTDSTRFTFSHADGSVGDISSANVYLNFVPLQEREEWPMEWAKNGNMPYSAIEFGPPYWNNFWKGNQFLLTEYLAMYQGDKAYQKEQPHALADNINKSLQPGGTTWEQLDFSDYPSFWDFQRLFTRNTNRAWRSWGVNAGWLYWLLEGYGDPTGPKKRFTSRYKLDSPVTQKPAWVNPRYEIFQEANKPLLAYIAGYPAHTDKTHTYYAGEAIQKQVAVVWDGSERRNLQAEWQLLNGKTIVQKGRRMLTVKGGEIRHTLFSLTAPVVTQRQLLQLVLAVKEHNTVLQQDTLEIDVFPRLPATPANINVAVYDPLNKSIPWLKQLGMRTVAWNKEQHADTKILVIGREALQIGQRLPYTAKDIEKGLKVIVLEQQPDVWEGMGFQTIETMPRYVFIRDGSSAIVKGLLPRDFINWRGTPDLLPAGKYARNYDMQKAPKWTNTHAIASVAIRTPEVAGFTPVLQTEFDMAYSPLLECRYGKGMVTYCSLDLTARVGSDPVATQLAVQLLQRQLSALSPAKTVYYTGDAAGADLMNALGIQPVKQLQQADPLHAIVVTGTGAPANKDTLPGGFLPKGGTVLYLPQTASDLQTMGLKASTANLVQVTAPGKSALLRAIGPNFLRWRDVLHTPVFAATGQPASCTVLLDGIMLERTVDKGKAVYLQVSPALLSDRYADSAAKKESIQLSVIRLQQLVAQVLTNMGIGTGKKMMERLCFITAPKTWQTLGAWKVLGPHIVETANGELTINTVFPGEQDAIEGAENPNNTFKRADGKQLDWRTVVTADKNGFVDLRKAFGDKDDLSVAYVTKIINSEKEQMAFLGFGVDYWMAAWLNGKPVVKVTGNHPKRENEFIQEVLLKKGENILTLKLASGRGGFGFWANISFQPGMETGNDKALPAGNTKLYTPLFKYFDPYQFLYW